MKVSLSYAAKVWGLYVVLMLVSLLFVAGISTAALQIIFSVLLLVAFLLLMFSEGAYNGEKACTLTATMEKQLKEGRRVDESARAWTFSRKTAVRLFVICLIPFLVISAVNLAVAPLYPEPEIEETEEEREAFYFDYDADPAAEAEAASPNIVNVVARLVYMPYVFTYTLVSSSVLNLLFLIYAFIPPAAVTVGYLCGPAMRKKKLHDIALGKKRKMRNLKVNKPKGPRGPKAEV